MVDRHDPDDPPTVLKPGCWKRGFALVGVLLLLILAPFVGPKLMRAHNLSQMSNQVPRFLENQGYEYRVTASGSHIRFEPGSGSYCTYAATFVVEFEDVDSAELDRIAGEIAAHPFEHPETHSYPSNPDVSVDRIDAEAVPRRLVIHMESGPWDSWRGLGC